MTPAADPFAALVREFELEDVHLKQMLALAEEEQRDLVTGDMARLDAISGEKLAQLHALELYTTQRSIYLRAQGFSGDATGLAACALAAGPRGRELTAVWKRVAEALGSLRDLNEENGALLRARLAEAGGPAGPLADLAVALDRPGERPPLAAREPAGVHPDPGRGRERAPAARAAAAPRETEPAVDVVGSARSIDEALVQAAALAPQLVLIDWNLPQPAIAESCRVMRLHPVMPKIVALLDDDDDSYRDSAAAAGADAAVGKGRLSEALLPLLEELFPAHHGK